MVDFNKLIKKTKHPYPQNKIEIGIVIAFLTIIAVGLVPSLYYSNWDHFERIGSLIVILGIYVAWMDITGNIDKRMYEEDKVSSKSIESIKHHKDGFMSSKVQELLIKEQSEWAENMQEYLSARKKRLRSIEAGLLAIGTLIWGYGGWVGSF